MKPVQPLSVESLTPRTSTYSTLRYELWKLERSTLQGELFDQFSLLHIGIIDFRDRRLFPNSLVLQLSTGRRERICNIGDEPVTRFHYLDHPVARTFLSSFVRPFPFFPFPRDAEHAQPGDAARPGERSGRRRRRRPHARLPPTGDTRGHVPARHARAVPQVCFISQQLCRQR